MNSLSLVRAPSKRKIKPPAQPVVDVEFGDSTDDSDFNIEDHNELSDDSFNSDDDNPGSASSQSGEQTSDDDAEAKFNSEAVDCIDGKSVAQLLDEAVTQAKTRDLSSMLICCVCLGDRSDHVNEIVECDRCGVTVHEGCYGVSDATSVPSTDSLTPTEPWFCEPCKAGVNNPNCELCPNPGGIFKITDVGRWVHLVCALYIPGVAFGEVDRLTNVTLFEMPYNKWGSKACGLCADERLARCGVQIGCDAGMCKQYFHVTCAQREGLLSETHSEEVDQADPFYAHCKLHTEKNVMRRRRNNYMLLIGRHNQRSKELEAERASPSSSVLRIERKLEKKRIKYLALRESLIQPWVPTQKMPRLLTTSASACRTLWRKSELMEVDVLALESKEAKATALAEVGNKWHIPPAFSVEFTSYFLDRNARIPAMKTTLQKLMERNGQLTTELDTLEKRYESAVSNKQDCENINSGLRSVIEQYHKVITLVEPTKRLPIIQDIILHTRGTHGSPMMVPTAAALKAGVGYPILRTNYKGQQRQTEPRMHPKLEQNGVTSHECGLCRETKDQHLLTHCDTCHLYYHLQCLNPPLTRMPKRTKQMGWQCSECDKETSPEMATVSGPRRSRTRPVFHTSPITPTSSNTSSETLPRSRRRESVTSQKDNRKPIEPVVTTPVSSKQKSKKRTSEENREETLEKTVSINSVPDIMEFSERNERKERKKRKKQKLFSPPIEENLPRIKIKIKTIMCGGKASGTTFVASSATEVDPLGDVELNNEQPSSPLVPQNSSLSSSSSINECDTCHEPGDKNSLVRCDECLRSFHFGCLDPPLKKSPKVRGYSWHCADCDPTDQEKK